ncbi:Cystathionine gamma-lyase [Paenibacillus nuruki]|nr:Cystathionine gamma-lyase [Paenibacillus nuruki]
MAVFDTQIQAWSEQAQQMIGSAIQAVDHIVDANQWKVIEAFQKYRVSDYHFAGSTGYAYNDRGREVLESVYAEVFGSEAALVRPHFASGTHTIATAMFGILRPGDELLYITGRPYDTLHKVIGKPGDGTGSLADFGITYQEAALDESGQVDWDTVQSLVHNKTKMIGIQRSRGYDWRASFTIEEIADMVVQIRKICPQAVIFVDNCYGEFTETREPTDVGVDLMAGSLIKNPGGGLAETGGYICGKQKYVDLAAYRLTAPGIGGEVGAMLGTTRSIYQGLYMAPTIVGQAVKGSIYAAAMFELAGFNSKPAWQEKRTDLIQAVSFKDEHQLIAFVQGIQRAAAVDSHVVPEPWDMPGYDHPVIMAAGTFIQGGV